MLADTTQTNATSRETPVHGRKQDLTKIKIVLLIAYHIYRYHDTIARSVIKIETYNIDTDFFIARKDNAFAIFWKITHDARK